MTERLLLLTAVHDEERHIGALVRGVAAQTRPPDAWIVIDDGSTDGTSEILRELARDLPWLEVRREAHEPRSAAEGLRQGAPARAFNRVLADDSLPPFTHYAVLDADVEAPPRLLEGLLEAMGADAGLGIVGPDLLELERTGWRPLKVPPHHVHGGARMYTRACLSNLVPLPELLGWDTIDQAYARMRGFGTRRATELTARHVRPCGAGDGALSGSARYGAAAYAGGQPLLWVLLRSAKMASRPPRGASGMAFLAGYLNAYRRRIPRVDDLQYRAFVRREIVARVRGASTSS